jgi:LysM repeat protein
MKRVALQLIAAFILAASALAQSTHDAQNDTVAKKLDELNAKIDALSQELLKLEQQLANQRPGVIIGEPTPATSAASAPTSTQVSLSGSSHTIAKGETLTSIAKMHHVTIDELQKANHIENDRKLQVGQTLIIPPPSGSPAASVSPAPSAQ